MNTASTLLLSDKDFSSYELFEQVLIGHLKNLSIRKVSLLAIETTQISLYCKKFANKHGCQLNLVLKKEFDNNSFTSKFLKCDSCIIFLNSDNKANSKLIELVSSMGIKYKTVMY